MGVAVEAPFEVVAEGGVVHVGGGGDFLAGVCLVTLTAVSAEAVGPAAEAVHVVAIPVETFDQLHLSFDEEVAVRRVPAAQDVFFGDIFGGDWLFPGGVEDLPIGMLLLEPGSHV